MRNSFDRLYLSKSELRALALIDEFNNLESLAKLLNKSIPQTYRILGLLSKKDIVKNYSLVGVPYLKNLVMLLKKYPNLIEVFHSAGLGILLELITPKTVKDIHNSTMIDEQTIYKVIQKAKNISLVEKKGKFLCLNKVAWPEAVSFFSELERQELSFDKRVPSDSMIYCKSKRDILFSNFRPLEDAELTAFSAFEKFGVKVFPATNYYYLPKNNLSKDEVFKHALLITNKEHELTKEWNMRFVIFLVIFVLKNKSRSNDPLAKKIKLAISGVKVEGFPSIEELKEKAAVYGVELK
jgi:hypothetical protein